MDGGLMLPAGASRCERLAGDSRAVRERFVADLPVPLLRGLKWSWEYWARAGQVSPEGAWRTWLILAGRGFGKTRAGAEWVRAEAEAHADARIALVAATIGEARAVMVEGQSGLLAIAPPHRRPVFEPSLRKLTWPNGAMAQLYSASEPESLRGPQHSAAWCDELGKWPEAEAAWDNLAMGLRLGRAPRTVVTTTPRPTRLLRRLIETERTAITRGRTHDNRAFLPGSFLADMEASYGGTMLGRQELDGEMIVEVQGALWRRAVFEEHRARGTPDDLVRVVIGVDPPAGANPSSDACGIVVAGIDADAIAYVLADASVRGVSPERWGQAVADAAARWRADRVVAEANNGGAMVESVLLAADSLLPVSLVHATQGKAARAEPVARLYERGRVRHCGAFPELEDELAGLMAGGGYQGPGRSPDRADALVWALTELLLGKRAPKPGVRQL
ncbi:terminase family protein [uncultured Sphingomonas sp.]|uniref:DNA-packaging protein n=1 Tax=uncultured Sphingomonas sp. TaxID=158754 RepID=UPI0025E56765|nr:terminase family protein [uncultured Sphingomonas sp.]